MRFLVNPLSVNSEDTCHVHDDCLNCVAPPSIVCSSLPEILAADNCFVSFAQYQTCIQLYQYMFSKHPVKLYLVSEIIESIQMLYLYN